MSNTQNKFDAVNVAADRVSAAHEDLLRALEALSVADSDVSLKADSLWGEAYALERDWIRLVNRIDAVTR